MEKAAASGARPPVTIELPGPVVKFSLDQDLGEVFGPDLRGYRVVSVLDRALSSPTFSADAREITEESLRKPFVLVARLVRDDIPHTSFIGKFSAHEHWIAPGSGLEKEARITTSFAEGAPDGGTPCSVEMVAFVRAHGMAAFVVPEYVSDLGPSCWDPKVRVIVGDLYALMKSIESAHVFVGDGVLLAAVNELWDRTCANTSAYQHCDIKPDNIFIYDIEYRTVHDVVVITRIHLILGDFGAAQVKRDVIPARDLGGTHTYVHPKFREVREKFPLTPVAVGSEIYDDRRGWDLTAHYARTIGDASTRRLAATLADPGFVPILRHPDEPPRIVRRGRNLRSPSWASDDGFEVPAFPHDGGLTARSSDLSTDGAEGFGFGPPAGTDGEMD